LIDSAIPYSQITDEMHNEEMLEITERATPLFQKDILAEVVNQCGKLGVVGEEHNVKILYLALTSRILDNPVSIAIKGTSSSGKSFILKKVLSIFPKTAYYDTSSMSDKALFYSEESFKHRFLIIHEAAGLSSSYIEYLIRILLSEGKIKHSTVENTDKGNKPRDLEKEGPTGFITTTTKITLNPENETRYLSIEISDDPEQTKRILLSIADDFMGDNETLDVDERFFAFQIWLERYGNKKVIIPYAIALAEMVKPNNVRSRRDFKLFLNLIKTRTIIYQHQRDQDPNGCIISTLEDYQSIHNLVSDVINEGAESSIKPIVRETVAAVRDLLLSDNNSDGGSIFDKSGETMKYVDLSVLSQKLGLDKSPTSRRVQQAIKGGFLENLESRRGYRAKIVLGQQLPEDFSIFPTPEELEKKWLGTVDSGAIEQHYLIDTGENYE
jgi:DNA-binding Lrp family transcriptional regulator